jgi:O-antigen ligase
MATATVTAHEDVARRPASEAGSVKAARASDDWPHTKRLVPWTIAVFIGMVFLVPIDGTSLKVHLPVDSKIDRFGLAAMVAALILQTLVSEKSKQIPRRMTATTGAVLLFVAAGLASVLPNIHRIYELGQLTLVEKRISQLLAFAVFFLIVATQVRRSEIRAYGRLVLALAILTSLGTLYESRTGVNLFYHWTGKLLSPIATVIPAPTNIHPSVDAGRKSIVGPTQHGLALASMLTVAMPFAVIRLFEVKRRGKRMLYLLAVGLIFAASLATARKTAIIAPIAALGVLAFYYPRMLRWAPLAAILLVPVIHVVAPGALGTFGVLSSGGSSISTQGRVSDYAAVRPDVISNPILGRGFGSLDPDNPRWYRVLDNEYLGELFQVGLLGLIAYLGMVITPLFTAHRVIRRDPGRAPPVIAAAAGCAAYAVVSGTFDAMSFPQAPYAFLFAAGLIAAAAAATRVERERELAVSARASTSQWQRGLGHRRSPASVAGRPRTRV